MYKIGVFLSSFLDELGLAQAVKVQFLRKSWRDIFPAPLCEHTFPREIKEDRLLVIVNSHAWLNELMLLKENFLEKLTPYGIKDVAFKFGRIYKPKISNFKKQKDTKLSQEQRQWIFNITSKLRDEEMRVLFKNLIEKHFIQMNEKMRGDKNEGF